MREPYRQYIKEHPEELRAVGELIRHSKEYEKARQERIAKKLALIQKCREELANEARNKRS